MRTVKEDPARNIDTVMTEGVSPDLTDTDSDSNSVDEIYDIGVMTSQMIKSVKVALTPSRNESETKLTVQDVPQAKTFHPKGSNSIVSPE